MAVSDPEFVVPLKRIDRQPPGSSRPFAELLGVGKEIGADLGPEERRLYRQIPENQGVPAAFLPAGVWRGPHQAKNAGETAHESRFRLSGTGIPGRRHGRRPGRGLCHRPGRLPGNRRGAEAESVEIDARRARIRPGPDRERPAGADGGQHRRHPRPGEGRRQAARQPGEPCRRPFARRILGAHGGGRPATRRCRAASEAARPIDAEGGAGGRGRDGGPARHRARARARGLQGSSARRGRHGGQRQWRRPGRGERPQGCRRALHRDGQAARRQARHAACR